MHGFVKVAAVGIAAVALLASCGGGQADTAAPTGSTFDVTASAGELQATLSLAPDGLPEGTAPRDVGLEMLVDENAESGAPTVALLLLPDGLILDEAATLTVGLPDALLNSAFMAIHVSGDSVEFLEGELVAVDGDVFFRIPITHFSLVDLTRIFGVIGSSLLPPQRSTFSISPRATQSPSCSGYRRGMSQPAGPPPVRLPKRPSRRARIGSVALRSQPGSHGRL